MVQLPGYAMVDLPGGTFWYNCYGRLQEQLSCDAAVCVLDIDEIY